MKKIDYLSYTKENDLPLHGRFGYRGLRILGWVFMCCLVLGTVMNNEIIINLTNANLGAIVGWGLCSFIGSLALPAFFIANFSNILMSRGKYKSFFIKYSIFIGIIFLLLYGFLFRYIILIANSVNKDIIKSIDALTNLLNANPSFGICANIFIDLMLCLLLWFFIDYTPKKHFQGKKLKLFRSFIILPILYELVSVGLKTYTIINPSFKVPFYIFPLLPNKPPILFFVFLAICLREKYVQLKYLKLGHTQEELDDYLTTNAASKSFSKFTGIAFLIGAVIDTIIYIVATIIITRTKNTDANEVVAEIIRIGLGKGISLIFMIPIMHFYSYNKTYKPSVIDTILPIVGLIVMVLICIESLVDIALLI